MEDRIPYRRTLKPSLALVVKSARHGLHSSHTLGTHSGSFATEL